MEGRGVGLRPVTEALFDWKDHSRFVEVYAVSSGWLVIWGLYTEMGAVRNTHGMRIYREAAAVRRRIAWAVLALTGKEREARDALALFDLQGGLPAHTPRAERGQADTASA